MKTAKQSATNVIVKCGCGRCYTAEQWAQLHLAGIQHIPAGGPGEPAYDLELRDCACRSTLSIEIASERKAA